MFWDQIVSQHILNGNFVDAPKEGSELWTFDMMKSYFSLVKNLQPTLTHSANQILSKYYYAQRQASERNTARTTVRMLESLIRYRMGIDQLMLMLVDFMDNIKSSVISLINQMSISLDYLLCSLIVIIIFF